MQRFSHYNIVRNILGDCSRKITTTAPSFDLDLTKGSAGYFQTRICDSIFQQLKKELGQYNDMHIESVIEQMKLYIKGFKTLSDVTFENNLLKINISDQFAKTYFWKGMVLRDWKGLFAELQETYQIPRQITEEHILHLALILRNENQKTSKYFHFFDNLSEIAGCKIDVLKLGSNDPLDQSAIANILTHLQSHTNEEVRFQKSEDELYLTTKRGKMLLANKDHPSAGINLLERVGKIYQALGPQSITSLIYPATFDKQVYDLQKCFKNYPFIHTLKFCNVGECLPAQSNMKCDLTFREYFRLIFYLIYFHSLSKSKFMDLQISEQMIFDNKILEFLEEIFTKFSSNANNQASVSQTEDNRSEVQFTAEEMGVIRTLLKAKDSLDGFLVTSEEVHLRLFLRLSLDVGEAYLNIKDKLDENRKFIFERVIYDSILYAFHQSNN